MVSGSLVAARRDGFGSAGSPASERRFGVVAWDVVTGARVARTLTGRVLTPADRTTTYDPVLTDEVAVVPVRLDTPDGSGRATDHGLLVSLQG